MKRFFKLVFNTSWVEKKLFFSALFWMHFYAIFLKIMPAKKWISQKKSKKSTSGQNKHHYFNLFQLKRALLRAGKCYLFQNKCLAQSLAGRKILKTNHISSTIYLGLSTKGNFIAHAWLVSNEFELVEKNDDFIEILKID
jgi:hypothetical protein